MDEAGELVGAGTPAEVLMLPVVLREGLGLSEATLARASAPDFDAVIRAERHAQQADAE